MVEPPNLRPRRGEVWKARLARAKALLRLLRSRKDRVGDLLRFKDRPRFFWARLATGRRLDGRGRGRKLCALRLHEVPDGIVCP